MSLRVNAVLGGARHACPRPKVRRPTVRRLEVRRPILVRRRRPQCGVVREVDLPTAPNQAILELHLFPRNGCCNGTKEERHQCLARYPGRVHRAGLPQRERLCVASRLATRAPDKARKRRCAATRRPRNGPQNGTPCSGRASLERRREEGHVLLGGPALVCVVLTWHMALSKTRQGSLPSANTTSSLPTAMPKGHFSRASAMLRLVSTIQLLANLARCLARLRPSSSGLHKFPDLVAAWSLASLLAIEGLEARLIRLLAPRAAKMEGGPCLGHPKIWPGHAAGGVGMAVLLRGSYLKGRAVLSCRCQFGGQSEEPLLTCARIRGTSLRSCIQCSQGLATGCKGCSGLGRHQSAEECIPAPLQVGSLQGAKVTVLGQLECSGSACRKELTLPTPAAGLQGLHLRTVAAECP